MEVSNLRNKRGQVDGKKALVYIRKRLEEGAMCKTIAAEIGVSQKTLGSMMSWFRSKGEHIPNMHYVAPEGKIRICTLRGIKYKEIKVNGKWKGIGRVEGQPYKERVKKQQNKAVTGYVTRIKDGKEVKEAVTVINQKVKQMPRCKEPKKEIDRLPTKVVDQNKIKTIRVSKTTYIQVDVNIPDDVAIKKWKEKYEQDN